MQTRKTKTKKGKKQNINKTPKKKEYKNETKTLKQHTKIQKQENNLSHEKQ